jgi:predicted transcriptional regulator
MKTVAQIAREIGVSKQAVHNKIKNEPLKSKLQGLTQTIDNALQIEVDGETLIKSAFSDKLSSKQIDELENSVDKLSNEIDETTTAFIQSLQEQITALNAQNEDLRQQLNEERAHSREQSNRILELAEQGQKLAENAQTLHAMESVKPQLTESTEQAESTKKRGFFGRFKRGKS